MSTTKVMCLLKILQNSLSLFLHSLSLSPSQLWLPGSTEIFWSFLLNFLDWFSLKYSNAFCTCEKGKKNTNIIINVKDFTIFERKVFDFVLLFFEKSRRKILKIKLYKNNMIFLYAFIYFFLSHDLYKFITTGIPVHFKNIFQWDMLWFIENLFNNFPAFHSLKKKKK